MKCIKNKVISELKAGWIGPNTSCEYHPCHYRGQDCTYCYCPFYPCNDPDLGKNIESKKGDIWDCSNCLFIHQKNVCQYTAEKTKRLGITDPEDERLKNIFKEAKERFFKLGRSVMVLGASSDAGKSFVVTALCRVLLDMGFSVTPLKTQNMSLNSVVTSNGSEIAMIQALQSKAAGVRRPDHHVNPILLKPIGDSRSQVMVNGKPFGDYDVRSYYNDFVPGPGIEAVKENTEYLRKRYDYVVIEGAGSPAEINIYDKDIANMRAAEIADADCILVVNAEWGGSFAYALGTIELLEKKDRKRIKAILYNNLSGDQTDFMKGAKELEKITGIPTLGIIPHISNELPNEDSAFFRGTKEIGKGKIKIAVVKLPRISNFTDIDPLYMEDVTVRFVDTPEGLEGADAIVIPGTKNTISDVQWLTKTGIAAKLKEMKGNIPILGLCGGYQMMGTDLIDDEGIEGNGSSRLKGLGFFNNRTTWKGYRKSVRQSCGTLIETGEDIHGYEIHMGESEVNERPLFKLREFKGERNEGSFIENEKLFGTYLHGVFDAPAFRRFFLSFVSGNKTEIKNIDHSEMIESEIQKLADSFVTSVDMDLFNRLFVKEEKQ